MRREDFVSSVRSSSLPSAELLDDQKTGVPGPALLRRGPPPTSRGGGAKSAGDLLRTDHDGGFRVLAHSYRGRQGGREDDVHVVLDLRRGDEDEQFPPLVI